MHFHLTVKKRVCAYVLMASLLALQIYLAFAAHQQIRVGTLHSGDYSIIQAMERTCDNALMPSKNDRMRVRIMALFEMVSAQENFFERTSDKTDFAAERHLYGIWNVLVGHALTSEPHSDMVLRI